MGKMPLPPLIPRSTIFGNPVKSNPQLSRDGGRMCYLAPDEGVLNVWVRTVGKPDDHAVTKDRGRGIRSYHWAEDGRHLLLGKDERLEGAAGLTAQGE